MLQKNARKVTIVGAGNVGTTIAYTLMMNGLFSELVLIDRNETRAGGEIMDLNHGVSFVKPIKIVTGSYEKSSGSDMVIITAGAAQKPGETRLDAVHKNVAIFKAIVSEIVKYNDPEKCIILIVTNPVDILTWVTWKISGFPKNRVIGSGTVLDTARLRYLISEHVGVDVRNVHSYIIGEHGDSELPVWSLANVGGIPMEEYCAICKQCDGLETRKDIFEKAKNAAYEIISAKGATYYAVALAVLRIVESIMRDERSILTVSSVLDGPYGLTGVSLSVPTVVYQEGVDRVVELPLAEDELILLKKSSDTLKSVIATIDL